MLTALEGAWQQRATYTTQLEELSQRLRELEAERKKLEARQPEHFPAVTQQLHDQYEAQLQATQAKIQELYTQAAVGQTRLATIAKELEQRFTERPQLEREVVTARSNASKAEKEPTSVSDVARLDVRLQLLQAEVEALEAERAWLTQRGPLHDALLQVAQIRLQGWQRDLQTIKQALGTAIEQEQVTLSRTAAAIQRQLEQTTDPLESLQLTVRLETIGIHMMTTEYRQQLNRLSNELMAQEKRNAQEKRDMDRLASLVEKYASGEGVAQRLLVAFERLRRERARYRDTSIKASEAQLRSLSKRMFALDDQLYEFNRQAEGRLAALHTAYQKATPPQQVPDASQVRGAFQDQKAALREQQQLLATLEQDQLRLLSMHREHKRLLDEGYLFMLTKMFWLRDGERMSLAVLRATVTGAVGNVTRVRAFVHAEWTRLRTGFSSAPSLWLLLPLLFPLLPWMAWKTSRRLQRLADSSRRTHASQEEPPGVVAMSMLVLRAAIWPAYLALIGWSRALFLPQSTDAFAHALVSGLTMLALVLWVGLLGRDILRPNGWGEQWWGVNPELRRFLRRIVVIGCFAALLFLVPRHVLLTAPDDPETATGSLALARFLLLVFQSVTLVLVGIAGYRQSLLVEAMLARSRQEEGLLWRIWPFVYLALLASLVAIITLDVLGYQYAARFIWLRALESLSVLLVVRLLVVILILRLLHRSLSFILRLGTRGQQLDVETEARIDRYFQVGYTVCNTLLALLAIGVILEVWGVSVSWFLTSPLGLKMLTRTAVVLLTIGLAIVVIQISQVITDYLLQPKTRGQGVTHQAGRKLKTLAPLTQTLIKVVVIFAAALMILEQLNVATGPILTGVGIFGLAVGFASQSLIKDVINGLFILFEDSLSVGDIVSLRGHFGVVEKVTLRAVTIRDVSGNVHVLPNSTLDMITNMSKDFSRYLLDVRVAYREDVDAVMDILREIDAEMRTDPAYRWDMLEPIEVMGVQEFADSGVIIRARLKTRAGQQWRIGREYNRRMKKVFDERGIQIPFPHRTLYWGAPSDEMPAPWQHPLELQQPQERENGDGHETPRRDQSKRGS
jgi:small-conductance mechanosensitive channel/uncharacterized small protein (DUF1192 family)